MSDRYGHLILKQFAPTYPASTRSLLGREIPDVPLFWASNDVVRFLILDRGNQDEVASAQTFRGRLPSRVDPSCISDLTRSGPDAVPTFPDQQESNISSMKLLNWANLAGVQRLLVVFL